jgi:hypothetical protein
MGFAGWSNELGVANGRFIACTIWPLEEAGSAAQSFQGGGLLSKAKGVMYEQVSGDEH